MKSSIPKHNFEVGQCVVMSDKHPWAGERGKIIAIEEIRALRRVRPRVRLENGQEVFIMTDEDAIIAGGASVGK